ncbi:hypothetical protein ACJIZ3_015795 [Penstemon smallii]|uniref:Bromo domain-containing protein n=1 Tax=Penstemon smallii TaxID=265156 RepID=A0ABD3RNH7_9LAMI
MKRKRGSAKRKPKKSSGAAASVVDPGYYSDVNRDNGGVNSRAEIEATEVNTDMSNQRVGFNKPLLNNETAGSAAAKLARAISSSCAKATSDSVPLQHESIGKKQPKVSRQAPMYSTQELDDALLVIKKIMTMNEATPFNAPVDPIALGIPDYFDIIDTPMDFGTICSKLEKGLEYRNSEDVFKDVQRIWDNCYKYNQEGSHILKIMRRVRNNFMKQWTAAGLYKDQQTISNGHLTHNPQTFVESTVRPEEAMHKYPVISTISSSAYLQQHDSAGLSQRPHEQLSPYYSHTFRPQQMSYLCSCSLYPGPHQHELAPQQNHFLPLHSAHHMNANSSNQWISEAIPILRHSYQPSPSLSHMDHPQQSTFLHQPSSSQMPPSRLQAGISPPVAGRYLPHRESSTLNNHEHAYNSGYNAGDKTHQQHHQMDPVHIQTYHSSASHMPAHHHLQSSHIEGGRNIDFAGNLHMPPPTESTANFTKRGSGCQRPPLTDNTSFHQSDQMNSTPEHSSSANNMEASNPLENAFQNQPGYSPSEHLHSTADNNSSKRKTQCHGLMQNQKRSPSLMNIQECRPKENIFQNQTGSLHSQPSPPCAENNIESKKKSRGRGHTRGLKLLKEDKPIPIVTNEQGQPVGPESVKLITFLGVLARDGNLAPLNYLYWKSVPLENKETMWQKVQSRFVIDPKCKDWVLGSLSVKWKAWKHVLKAKHYHPHETDEERLADRDERVLPDQWEALIALWNTEAVQARSASNRANRSMQKYNHAAGAKSFARLREEQRAKRPDGKELSRAELFVLTRTRRNGEPINEASSEVIKKLHDKAKDDATPQESNKQHDILSEIIGPNKYGRSRCLQLGTSPFDLQKPTRAEAIKMVCEAKVEMVGMKEKISVVEQTCAQMASQMAAMMSMMSSMQKSLPDKNVPNMVANSSGASDHSLTQPVKSKPASRAASSRQTRVSKRKT